MLGWFPFSPSAHLLEATLHGSVKLGQLLCEELGVESRLGQQLLQIAPRLAVEHLVLPCLPQFLQQQVAWQRDSNISAVAC